MPAPSRAARYWRNIAVMPKVRGLKVYARCRRSLPAQVALVGGQIV
jgi:hypothetical protein